MNRDGAGHGGQAEARVHVSADAAAAADALARAVVAAARHSVEARGRFTLALSGGSTPRPAYELLGTRYAGEVDWGRAHIFFVDERCVPADHHDSNYRMVRDALTGRVPLPPGQVHPMFEAGTSPAEAALRYEELLRAEFGAAGPWFDAAVMGIGPDGHTASLFPDASALGERERRVLHVQAPPAFAVRDRLTLTIPALNACRRLLFLATGASKREVVARALRGDAAIPAALVSGAEGTDWYLDGAAAPA